LSERVPVHGALVPNFRKTSIWSFPSFRHGLSIFQRFCHIFRPRPSEVRNSRSRSFPRQYLSLSDSISPMKFPSFVERIGGVDATGHLFGVSFDLPQFEDVVFPLTAATRVPSHPAVPTNPPPGKCFFSPQWVTNVFDLTVLSSPNHEKTPSQPFDFDFPGGRAEGAHDPHPLPSSLHAFFFRYS